MRIVLDLQGWQVTNRERGIGRYSLAFAKALVARAKRHEVVLALNGGFMDSVLALCAPFAQLFADGQIKLIDLPSITAARYGNTWRKRAAELIRESVLCELAPDIVHASSIFEGFVDDAVTAIGPSSRGFIATATLYDLIPLDHPEWYLKDAAQRDWYFRRLQSAKNADALLAISEHSRERAISALRFPDDRAFNVSAAVDAAFERREIAETEGTILRARYGLTGGFVMYLGGSDPRKNMDRLCEAYARVAPHLRRGRQLAIACAMSEADRRRLSALAAEHGLASDELVLLGPVPDQDLIDLYNLCDLFVFPSLDEGFGLPVLEAMQCGAPVIGSNVSSIPEVIGRADSLFDPGNAQSIAAALERVLGDPNLREELRRHSLRQAQGFSWDKVADRAMEVFESLVDDRRPRERPRRAFASRRKYLALVTPLPPVRSGIADYAAELLPELARHYEVEIISDQETLDGAWLQANFPVRSPAWFAEHADKFDRVVYQLGNNAFHAHMFPALRRIAGVVVLHDLFLSSVLHWMEATGQAPDAFRTALYRSHGYHALHRLQEAGDRAAVWEFPCSRPVLDSAAGVIVHSHFVQRAADAWYGEGVSAQWHVVPQLRALAEPTDRTRAKEALGLPANAFVVCAFGFVNPLKGIDALLRAWNASSLGLDTACHLCLVGENDPGEYGRDVAALIAQSSAAPRIRITGYVSPEAFATYLSATDVAVQLRTMTRGETSRSVLDCLAYGVPVLANANGPMTDFPPGVVEMLPDAFTQGELVAALERLRADAGLRGRMAQAGREHLLRRHHPRTVGDAYRDAIEAVYEESPHAAYRGLVASIARIDVGAPPQAADLSQAARAIAANRSPPQTPQLLLDASELIRFDSKSGIQRVVRHIARRLLREPPPGFRTELVYLKGQKLFHARTLAQELAGIEPLAFADEEVDVRRQDVFVGLDLCWMWSQATDLLQHMRMRGAKSYFVVYDLLPVLRPEFFNPPTTRSTRDWLNAVALYADGLICNSKAVETELRGWLELHPPPRREPLQLGFFHLGSDFDAVASEAEPLPEEAARVLKQLEQRPTILMVGTVEPRKGHAQVLVGFESLWAEGVEVNLAIVGKQGWHVEQLAKRLKSHREAGRRLFWLKEASDAYLSAIYRRSAALLAASEGEGFGLPLVEAARRGLPVIARDLPVFREIAQDGALFFSGLAGSDIATAVKEWIALPPGQRPNSAAVLKLSWEESTERLLAWLFPAIRDEARSASRTSRDVLTAAF